MKTERDLYIVIKIIEFGITKLPTYSLRKEVKNFHLHLVLSKAPLYK